MRYKILFILLVASTFSWAQTDSIDVNDILNRLKKLEELKAKDVTVNSLKSITKPAQKIKADPIKVTKKHIKVKEETAVLKSDSLTPDAVVENTNPLKKEPKVLKSDSTTKVDFVDATNPQSLIQPIITFEQDSLGVGNLVQGDVIKQKFVFKNTGNKTLYVVKIIVDCGCTEPEWTQDAIAPGESGHVIATYDSKDDIGKIQKSLTVVHNSGDGLSYLMFTGFVAPKLE